MHADSSYIVHRTRRCAPLPPVKSLYRRWTVYITGLARHTGRIVLPEPVTYDAPTARLAEHYVEGLLSAAAPGVEWEAIAL